MNPELELMHIWLLLDSTNHDCDDYQILTSQFFVYRAKYNTIFLNEKHGALWAFDSAVSRLLEKTSQSSTWSERTEKNERLSLNLSVDYDVHKTWFF